MPRGVTKKASLPTITFDEARLGPAMRALTPLQRAFVHHKVFYGLDNIEAQRRAGYGSNYGTLRSSSHDLAHHPGVQAAIEEETRKLMRTEGPKSVLTLVEIRDNNEVAARDRIKASVELLNRGGLHAHSESTLNIHVSQLTDAEKDREILRLAKELGLGETEAKKLLIAPDDFKQNSKGVYEIQPEPVDPETAARRKRDAEKQRRCTARRKLRQKMTPEEAAADRELVRREQAELRKRVYAEHQARRAAEEAAPNYVDINLIDDTENEPESQR